MTTSTPAAVLFDLDGTLLDTAGDMVGAVNRLLAEENLAPRPLRELTPYVSQGGLELVSRGFNLPREKPETHALWARYLDIYERDICELTRPFPGIATLLQHLTKRSAYWGIVTNKPERFTLPLMDRIELPSPPDCVVSGDTLAVSKPSPEPVLFACRKLSIDPRQAIMVGDDERDIVAGREAGCRTVAVTWGYLKPGDDPARWGADIVLDTPAEIGQWLD